MKLKGLFGKKSRENSGDGQNTDGQNSDGQTIDNIVSGIENVSENDSVSNSEEEIELKDSADSGIESDKDQDKEKNGRFRNPIRLYILDKYILKKFLGTFFLSTLLFLAVIAMFDITEKLDAFLTAPLKETLFDYFLSFLPYFGNQLSPLFVFISVIFFTSKMAGNSEIIAILSSGVSFRRLLRPYMIGAAVIAAMTFVLSNYLIPH